MEWMRQAGTAAAVIALLAVALWLLRRNGLARFIPGRGGSRAPRRLEAVERLALAPQHVVHMVRVDERVILIGQSPSGLSLLDGEKTGRGETVR